MGTCMYKWVGWVGGWGLLTGDFSFLLEHLDELLLVVGLRAAEDQVAYPEGWVGGWVSLFLFFSQCLNLPLRRMDRCSCSESLKKSAPCG